VVALAVAALAATGTGIALAGSDGGSLTVTRDGAVVDGRAVNGYVHVKANNVTIKNTTVRYGGSHAVRIFDGFTGTVIEDSRITCTESKTNGVVFGNYTARRVQVTGCRRGFVYSDSAPATITDSTWNGNPLTVGTALGAGLAAVTATPTPTPRATPTPGATPTRRPRAAGTPDRAPRTEVRVGRPGPDDTGVPTGTSLRRSGSVTVTRDGTVLSGLDITGCVTVQADNVVIRRSRITCDQTYSIRTMDSASNLLVEDVEIDGRGKNSAAVCCGNYTLRRVDIHDVIDGPRLGGHSVVEDSWIHHLTRTPDSHNDALQTTGATDIVVRGNSLEPYNPDTRDPLNACLMIGSTTGPVVADLLYEGNYCNGGNYSIGIRDDLNASNIRFRNNTFGRDYRFGVVAHPDHPGITWDNGSNLYADNRQPVVD
jgi:hypothetical protein